MERRILSMLAVVLLLYSAMTVTVFAAGEEAANASRFYQTIWPLLPTVIVLPIGIVLTLGILAGYQKYD